MPASTILFVFWLSMVASPQSVDLNWFAYDTAQLCEDAAKLAKEVHVMPKKPECKQTTSGDLEAVISELQIAGATLMFRGDEGKPW